MSVNPIKGKYVRLQNDEALKARNQADSADVEILKVNTTDQIEVASLPVYDDGVDVSQLSTEKYVDGEIATVNNRIDDHVGGLAENHPAGDITVSPVGDLASTDVQAALEEIQGDASQALTDAAGAQSTADNHISNATDAHDASAISFSNGTSGLAAINVQSAIDEVESRVDALEVGGGDTKEVKVSANDSTPGFLEDKISGAAGKISISTLNEGADEDLQISIGGDIFDKTIDTTDLITEGVSQLFFSDLRARTAVVVDGITDGVIDQAPSMNAVHDALALKLDAGAFGTEFDTAFSGKNTDNLSEGVSNLYFTDARAQSAAVEDAIVDGIINKAPSQNAVHDALALKLDLAGGTMSGFITLHSDPSSPLHAASKQYVDAVAEGLHVHAPARLLADFDLDGTYNNGTAGVGAYLDFSGSPVAGIDGVSSFSVGDRIIVNFQNGSNLDPENGIYYIAASGDIDGNGDIIKLTRAVDFNTPAEMAGGDFVFVQEGSQYGDTGWVMTETVATVGTTPVKFVQFSGAGTYSAGDALELNGTQFHVLFDDASIGINGSNQLYIKDGGVGSDELAEDSVTAVKINSDVAGLALEKGLSESLNVRVDSSTIEIDGTPGANNLRVKDSGITEIKLANDAVTTSKIFDDAVTKEKINSDVAGLALEKGLSEKLDVRVDSSTIEIDGTPGANNLRVKDSGITEIKIANDAVTTSKIFDDAVTKEKINSDVAGLALEKGLSEKLDVRVDSSTIEIDGTPGANNLRVKDSGITEIKLANDAVTTSKIFDDAVTKDKINSDVAGLALSKGLSEALDVRVDSSTIEIDGTPGANNLRVKDSGITEIKLANLSVSTAKLQDDSVDKSKIASDVAGTGLQQNLDGSLEIKLDGSSLAVGASGLKSNIIWHKESYAVASTLTSGAFFDLDHVAEVDSISAFVDRLAIHEGASEDYSVSYTGGVGGVTRITFLNSLVSPGQQQLTSGDNVFFKYQRKAA